MWWPASDQWGPRPPLATTWPRPWSESLRMRNRETETEIGNTERGKDKRKIRKKRAGLGWGAG